MTRRDMIIIAVLVNLGILAIIFMTAIGFDSDDVDNTGTSTTAFTQTSLAPEPIESFSVDQQPNKIANGDEVDRVLNLYASQENNKTGLSETLIVSTPADDGFEAAAPVVTNVASSSTSVAVKQTIVEDDSAPQYVEITVKKGDFLDKIARANGTTADRLMQINHLHSDRIDIGQVLKVPVSNAKKGTTTVGATGKKAEKKTTETASTSSSSDAQYYTVKSGDNPWKIARQFHVKFDELLRLNNLNEEKAKNLKVGDKIRVK